LKTFRLYHENCLKILPGLEANSIDSIVTDPPYGLSFMGKKWDYDVPTVEIWKECLRVLKPGGHMLAACGTRTQHRMAVNIEDAGFEIRDVVSWIYGQGFPKSQDISKAIDKAAGAEREVIGHKDYSAPDIRGNSYDQSHVSDRERLGVPITKAATSEAQKWSGWGTALKPACEFWTLARKPLSESTIAKNVLKHGTGGLNIDQSRIGYQSEADFESAKGGDSASNKGKEFLASKGAMKQSEKISATGRFPANVILDEEAGKILDGQTGELTSGKPGIRRKPHSGADRIGQLGTQPVGERVESGFGDTGGASRFFYCAKSSKSDRNSGLPEGVVSTHPTVKPIKLMEYLIKLITPEGGVVLDPFMGSGTTGVACSNLDFSFIGIEMNYDYIKIAEARTADGFANE
jgi:site-specific DNA-methyltransferase (adenine-specific)